MAVEDALWPRADTWLATAAEDPDLVVVGVPTSSASPTPSEAWRTPALVRAALGRFSVFDGERGFDLRAVAVRDEGDWDVAGLEAWEAAEAVRRRAAGLRLPGVAVFLGGDDAITRPLVNGLGGGDLGRVGILTLDAHHDVRSTEPGPGNGSSVRGLIEDGLPDGRVIQIGIHSFADPPQHRSYCDEHGVEVITMETVDEVGAEWAVASALNDLAARCDWIYVDIDVAVLDPAFAPGCPGARPGGMSPRQLAAAARAAGAHPAVRAADLVEVDPSRDPAGLTIMNAAAALLAFAAGVAARKEDHG